MELKFSTVKKKRASRGRYGAGSLHQVGRFWHVAYREVRRKLDGTSEYVQHRESTRSTDRNYAENYLRDKLGEIGGRRDRPLGANAITYEDLRDAYVADAVDRKLRSLRRGTIKTGPLDRYFSGWTVADFTVASLKRYRSEALRRGLTNSTVNRHMAALRRMFMLAVENEWLELKDIPSHFPHEKEPNKAVGAVYIEKDWYRKLRRELSEPLRSTFIMCYKTGIRVGEARRLRWRDVNWQRRVVILPREITKTGEPRTVFLPKYFTSPGGKPDDPMFPIREDYIQEFKRCCVRLGIGHYRCRACRAVCQKQRCPTHGQRRIKQLSYVGPTLRHTRHTALRNMIDAGVDRDRAKGQSGHLTDATFSRYNIGRERDAEWVAAKVEKNGD